MKNNYKKYLDHYAEPIARTLSNFELPRQAWRSVLIIPCYAEADLIESNLASIEKAASHQNDRTLTIFVINCKNSDNQEAIETTAKCLEPFKQFKKTRIVKQVDLYEGSSFDCLVLDFASAPFRFPKKQGVGLARKIGCDIAIALMHHGAISSSWIHTSDVDVIFPKDYFDKINTRTDDISVINYNFKHVPYDSNSQSWDALQIYEISLRYYVLGLLYSKSPYSYHSIGSTLCINATSYVAVRGFPKRLAGEDFHILNKLSKVGKVERSQSNEIYIKNRPSKRVPFGTGMAVAQLTPIDYLLHKHTFYDPRCFEALKEWLELVPHIYTRSEVKKIEHLLNNQTYITRENFSLLDQELGLREGIRLASLKSKDIDSFLKHFHTWFDALKTLRFIHTFREHIFPSISSQKALLTAPFLQSAGLTDTDSIESLFSKVRDFEYQEFRN